MEAFFLEGLTDKQLGCLAEKEIPSFTFKVNIGGNEKTGIVIDEDNIASALIALGLEMTEKSATDCEGVFMINSKKKGKKTDFSVIVNSWNGENQDGFISVIEENLLPLIKENVYLSVPHNSIHSPDNDGNFHIWIWSSPKQQRKEPPAMIWGHKVDCRDTGYVASGLGTAIFDPDTGWEVAELVGHNLYIHHDLCHKGTTSELKIFSRLLEEVIMELTLKPAEKAKRRKQYLEEQLALTRSRYITECTKRFKQTAEMTRDQISRGKREIRQKQQELVHKIREIQAAESKVSKLSKGKFDAEDLDKFGQEYDKLLSLPKVKQVDVWPGVIQVTTDLLFCQNPRTKKIHEIGKFLIKIDFGNDEPGVKWFNQTRQIDGYKCGMQAPHIFPEGQACLGNIETIIPELIANYEFSALIMLAIQFVESVNLDDDAGQYLENWPLKKD